jgi:exopolysaccharide biosynthesis polyprenyl glycosylphosphotransferase
MIREQHKLLKRVLIVSDLCLVTISFLIGYFLRDKVLDIYPLSFLEKYLWDENLRPIGYYAIYIGLLPVLLFIWWGLLTYFGMYKSSRIGKLQDAIIIIFKTTVVGFILFGSYVFILRMQDDISRLFVGFTFFSAAFLISLEKIALVNILKILSRRSGSFKSTLVVFRNILIVGTGKRAKVFMDLIKNNPFWGIKILGIVDVDPKYKGEIINGYKVIGSLDDMPEILSRNIIDEVVFIVPRSWLNKIEDVILLCESAGLTVDLAVNLFELKLSKAKQTDLGGFPLLTFESTPEKLEFLFVKRMFDFVASGIGLIFLLPLFAIIAIVIKVTSKGLVFYKQERCGLYGRRFIFYKFRTMVQDADSRLQELLKYNEMDGPVFKMTNDPRITKIGKWLRKYSLDELPQLWNVLKGDMSLVGPRPPLPAEVQNYNIWQRRKLSMRPGITCLWQVSGRNKISDFKEWASLDLEYIDNWSLWLDFKILFKTIPVVLLGIGAK